MIWTIMWSLTQSFNSPSSSALGGKSMVPTAGNHPHTLKSILISPVRPVVTSTPSASNSSRWNWAPCVPGPRDEMVPLLETTRCHGTGGFVSGERNFRAKSRAMRYHVHVDMQLRGKTLSDESGMMGHPNKLRNVAYIPPSNSWSRMDCEEEEAHRSLWPFGLESVVQHGKPWKMLSSELTCQWGLLVAQVYRGMEFCTVHTVDVFI